MIELMIPALPVAQPRTRATSIHGHARTYTPKDHPVQAFKASVRLSAKQHHHGAPLDGPLQVDCVFVFPRPKNMLWKRKPMPRVRHSKKPDRDNLDKAVLDALNGLLWRDDCQVCAGTLEKWIAAGDEQPHVKVTIREL